MWPMPVRSGRLPLVVAVVVVVISGLGALLLATGDGGDLGLLGLLTVLVGPGVALTLALSQRPAPIVMRLTAAIALTLSSIALLGTALGASDLRLRPETVGVGVLVIIMAAAVIWVVRLALSERRPEPSG